MATANCPASRAKPSAPQRVHQLEHQACVLRGSDRVAVPPAQQPRDLASIIYGALEGDRPVLLDVYDAPGAPDPEMEIAAR